MLSGSSNTSEPRVPLLPAQGPKKKGKKGAKGDKPASGGGDEENIASDDLKGMIKDMTMSRAKEQEERNYFQLERDKINTFWGA